MLRARGGFDLLVAGELNPDIIVTGGNVEPEFGQVERLVDRIAVTVGSSSAITTWRGAPRAQGRVRGVVGADPFGRWMLDALAERGVDVAACRIDPSPPTGASVILAHHRDRAIVRSGRSPLSPGGPARRAARARTPPPRREPFPPGPSADESARGLRRARTLGVTTSVDPNWDLTGTWDGGIGAILETTDVVLPNREEALRIAHVENEVEAGRRLSARGPVVAMKLGAEGGLVFSRDAATLVDAPPVDAIDAVGAGDAFDAGFLAGWLDGRAPEQCPGSRSRAARFRSGRSAGPRARRGGRSRRLPSSSAPVR